MKKLTAFEVSVMECIPKECFYENGFDSVLWMDCFLDTVLREAKIENKKSRAVVVNLEKKGLLTIAFEKRDIDGSGGTTFVLAQDGKDYLVKKGLVEAGTGYVVRQKVKTEVSPKVLDMANRISKLKSPIPEEVKGTVVLRAFTNLVLGKYPEYAELDGIVSIVIGSGRELTFDKETGKQTNALKPKFANKITWE